MILIPKSKSESPQFGLQMVGTIDEKQCVFNVVPIPEFLKKLFG
jgi:hypothetical protein